LALHQWLTPPEDDVAALRSELQITQLQNALARDSESLSNAAGYDYSNKPSMYRVPETIIHHFELIKIDDEEAEIIYTAMDKFM
jgi:hypothetical protein